MTSTTIPGRLHKNTSTAAHNGACSSLTSRPIASIWVAAKIMVKAASPNENGPKSSLSI